MNDDEPTYEELVEWRTSDLAAEVLRRGEVIAGLNKDVDDLTALLVEGRGIVQELSAVVAATGRKRENP